MSKLKSNTLVIKGDEIGYISNDDDQSFGMFCPLTILPSGFKPHLLESAPDLLEALQSALQTAEFEKHAARPWHHEARAAIKKATQ